MQEISFSWKYFVQTGIANLSPPNLDTCYFSGFHCFNSLVTNHMVLSANSKVNQILFDLREVSISNLLVFVFSSNNSK